MGKIKNLFLIIAAFIFSGFFTFGLIYIWFTQGYSITERLILSIIPFIAGPLLLFNIIKGVIKDIQGQKSQESGLFGDKPIYSHIVRGIYTSIIIALLIYLGYLVFFTDTF